MKELLQTMCTPSNVKLLTGIEFKSSFPLKYPKTTERKKMELRKPQTLAEIIKASPNKVRSFDSRFDGKHPIELAIYNLQNSGFTREQVYKLLHTKSAVTKKRIEGGLKYLSNFITDEHKSELVDKLREVEFDKGGFRRNGQLF